MRLISRAGESMGNVLSDTPKYLVNNVTQTTQYFSKPHINVLVVMLVLACVFYKYLVKFKYVNKYLDSFVVKLIVICLIAGLTFTSPMVGVLFATWYILSITHIQALSYASSQVQQENNNYFVKKEENNKSNTSLSLNNPYFDLQNKHSVTFEDTVNKIISNAKKSENNIGRHMSSNELKNLVVKTNDESSLGNHLGELESADFENLPRNIHNEPDGMDNDSGYAAF